MSWCIIALIYIAVAAIIVLAEEYLDEFVPEIYEKQLNVYLSKKLAIAIGYAVLMVVLLPLAVAYDIITRTANRFWMEFRNRTRLGQYILALQLRRRLLRGEIKSVACRVALKKTQRYIKSITLRKFLEDCTGGKIQ